LLIDFGLVVDVLHRFTTVKALLVFPLLLIKALLITVVLFGAAGLELLSGHFLALISFAF